ncbi:MAG TPA: IPT/TIG domain-containing protein [Planctomycetota bacterium]|nr:IPT/TIG domain-containing protein [Planctomycetota bacterium]
MSRRVALEKEVPTAVLETVDVDAYLAEDAVAPKDRPFRFGATLPVDFGLDGSGVWESLANGDRVWRLRIHSPGAFSLSAVFSRFVLPPGGAFYVYDDSGMEVLGAYDRRNENANGQFAFEPLPGDVMTLEYDEPAAVAGRGEIRIQSVIHDYRDILRILKEQAGSPDATSQPCEVDVNCHPGAPWQKPKRAVTVVFKGGGACTGSLLNNTANDGTQYYMSAYHCGSMDNGIFRFNFEHPICGGGAAPTNHTVQGSVELAANMAADYRLVRITSPIPAAYEPYFLGWDRSTTTIPTSTIAIHHPSVDVKKISFDDDPPTKQNNFWHISQWDLGVTEGGSSGSPLLNSVGRFLGQLCCGASFCPTPFNDNYGRFDLAWPAVAPFLDPMGTGATTIDGFDPAAPGAPSLSSIEPVTVQAFHGGTITLHGSHFGGATMVTVGSTPLVQPGVDFVIASDSEITFEAPAAASLGPVVVTVANPAGTSGYGGFSYVETHPPVLEASSTASAGLTFSWTWGSSSHGVSYLVYSPTPTTFSFAGFAILQDLQALDVQALPEVGIGHFDVGIPAGLAGATLYTQVLGLDGGGVFVGASNIVATSIL